ncbi:MAG: TraB/GumN family protein [Methanotrichaceae archaeon]|nr:TraB/GumN family protein [Methanotrichaceae archaeon]
MKEDEAPACQLVVPGTESTGCESHEVIIVGTAHVSEKSVQEVISKIEETRPDIVAVELCPARYKALIGQEEEKDIKISELLSGSKLFLFLVQLFLAYIQRKIGEEMGVKPGSEMLAAIEAAKKAGARVALVDRDIGITIQRFWSAMGFIDKIRLVGSLIPAAFGRGDEEIDIDSITQADIVSQMISEFRKISPGAANVLIDERDAFLARNLFLLSKQGRVLAVVGAGHREGIVKHLEHPEKIPALEGLSEKPSKKVTFAKIFGVVVSLLILATIVLVLITAQSSEILLQACVIWFVVTGGLSALGVVLARGHPLSVLTALMVAWMTTLNPFVAAGWFAGMVEAWKLKPTVSDLKKLAAADSFKQMMENRLFKVIFVAALANVGAMAGTFIGVYIIWQWLGLDISAEIIWETIKNGYYLIINYF